jgi:hypothetical protein
VRILASTHQTNSYIVLGHRLRLGSELPASRGAGAVQAQRYHHAGSQEKPNIQLSTAETCYRALPRGLSSIRSNAVVPPSLVLGPLARGAGPGCQNLRTWSFSRSQQRGFALQDSTPWDSRQLDRSPAPTEELLLSVSSVLLTMFIPGLPFAALPCAAWPNAAGVYRHHRLPVTSRPSVPLPLTSTAYAHPSSPAAASKQFHVVHPAIATAAVPRSRCIPPFPPHRICTLPDLAQNPHRAFHQPGSAPLSAAGGTLLLRRVSRYVTRDESRQPPPDISRPPCHVLPPCYPDS